MRCLRMGGQTRGAHNRNKTHNRSKTDKGGNKYQFGIAGVIGAGFKRDGKYVDFQNPLEIGSIPKVGNYC